MPTIDDFEAAMESVKELVKNANLPCACCRTCRHDLGGGYCQINVEMECCESGGFELWEEREI